jgi:tRNA G18 (ribose-2'-O)-methylase SpoU
MQVLAHNDIPRLDPAMLSDARRHPVMLLLDHIRSAHNVGSMLRTADALLLNRVVMSGFTPDGTHRGVHKSALGAQDLVPWHSVEDTLEAIHSLRKEGWTIAALEITTKPARIEQLEPDDYPLVIVAGNEVDGVSPEVLRACDMALELPQFGAKQSLNVSVAAGVLCYDAVRHYRSLKGLPHSPDHDNRI